MDIIISNKLFFELCEQYNLHDENILRRFTHGLTTAECCFSLASSLFMSRKEREFIYAVGLLHDCGRLVQWQKYASFSDSKTVPHQIVGVELLKDSGYLNKFFPDKKDANLAVKLILHHTSPYSGKDKHFETLLNILRDSDLYSNLTYTSSGLQRLWVNQNGVSPQILAQFRLRQNLHGSSIRTKLDRVLQFLSRTYELKHNILRRDLLARKYINTIYDVYSPLLIKEDKDILYKECWLLKKELAEQVMKHDKEKEELLKNA